MESEKDTSKKDIVKEGQNSPIVDTSAGLLKRDISINKAVFSSSGKYHSVSLRSEKLVAATYLIAGLMPENDPLRARIREASLRLLSDTYISNGHDDRSRLCGLINSIDLISGLFSVALAASLVSVMNYSILKNEYEKLRELIKSIRESGDGVFGADLIFGEEFFSVPPENTAAYDTGLIMEKLLRKGQGNADKGQTVKDAFQTTLSFMGKKTPKGQRASYGTPNNTAEIKSNRKDQILKIVRKRKTVTIKDISGEISGCSEKTIQRELSSLVSGGVLKKEGEKRWSRYSLI